MSSGKSLMPKPTASLRAQALTHKPNHYDEISPVTNGELDAAFRKANGKSTETTPSPLAKRKRSIDR